MESMSKNIFCVFICILFFIFATFFSCQNKTSTEKEHTTTVTGKLTKPAVTFVGRIPVTGATITALTFSTTTDTNGIYSLTIAHNGSFILTISDGVHADYNELVSTESLSIVKNHDY